jgi:hypothetical protein
MQSTHGRILVAFLALVSLPWLAPRPAYAGPTLEVNDEAWLKINYEMQLHGPWRNTGSGPAGTGATTDIYFRRNRLTLAGQMTNAVGFVASIQHLGDRRISDLSVSEQPERDFDVLDAFVTAEFHDAFKLRAGLTKDQLAREHDEGCFFPLSLDRSLFIYTPLPRNSRDYGIVAWGNALGARLQYRLAAMKGNDSDADPGSSLRYTGRVHVSLFEPESSIVYRGTYLGEKRVLTFGAGYQLEPDAVYGNVSARTLAKGYQAWTLDGFFEYPVPSVGTFTVSGAYLQTDFDGAYKGGDPDPRSTGINGEKSGWYAKAGYLLPMKIGPGSLQAFARLETWSFAELSGIVDQEIRWAALGVNYYLRGQDLRVGLEYSRNDFVTEDAESRDFDTVTAMLQTLF